MKRLLLSVLLGALLTAVLYDYPGWRMRQAYRKFLSGNFAGAVADWSFLQRLPVRRSEALFNRGVAACRMGNYSAALSVFRSASSSDDQRLRGKALYNLGTTLLRMVPEQGVASGAADERHLREAVKSLQDASSLDPSADDAAVNLNIARVRLSAILKGTEQRATGDVPQPQQRQGTSGVGEKKQGEPKAPGKGAAKSGQATDRDQEEAKRRRLAMDRNEALRMLDEARGREALRSATPAFDQGGGLTPPEKDW